MPVSQEKKHTLLQRSARPLRSHESSDGYRLLNWKLLLPSSEALDLSQSETQSKSWNKEKVKRHADNLSRFTGFYHGVFYWRGNPKKG